MSSVISPIPVSTDAIINAVILLAITVVVYVPCLIKKGMGRIVGGLSVIAYIGYTVYLLLTTI